MGIAHIPEVKYTIQGSGQETILFVHCALANSQIWSFNIHALGRYFRTISYDLRGHGESNHSALELVTLEDHVNDLREIIENVAAASCHIVALSMGGIIVQEYLKTYEHRGRIIFVSSPAESIVGHGQGLQKIAMLTSRALLGIFQGVGLKFLFHVMFGYLKPDAKRLAYRSFKDTTSSTAQSDIGALIQFRAIPEHLINLPVVHVIVGEKDAGRVHRHGRMLRNIFRCDQTVLSGTGHLPNLEDPAQFNDALLEYLGNAA